MLGDWALRCVVGAALLVVGYYAYLAIATIVGDWCGRLRRRRGRR